MCIDCKTRRRQIQFTRARQRATVVSGGRSRFELVRTRCSSLAVREVLEGIGVDRDGFFDTLGEVIEEEGVEREASGDFFASPVEWAAPSAEFPNSKFETCVGVTVG